MAAVKFEDLLDAFDFVGSGSPMEHQAYISLDTGEIVWLSEFAEDEDVPEDLETSDRYIEVPHKSELDLGRDLALRFADEALADEYVTVQNIFARRGAYARFKDLLASRGCLDRWYAFEADAVRSALKQWCSDNDIEVIESQDRSPA